MDLSEIMSFSNKDSPVVQETSRRSLPMTSNTGDHHSITASIPAAIFTNKFEILDKVSAYKS